MPETNARIKVCHDTAANFKTNNPTLLVGEWAFETDTKKMKIGDGTTPYNSLQYSTAEESEEWQKPSDWIDIRSGAVDNSVYFLVGHSSDYATYTTFPLKATISNSGTYDVYVDGIKQFTTASNTTTTINWQTLALSSGYDVTHPSTLRTHIVRVTPTTRTNTITAIQTDGTIQIGLLWAHFQLSNNIGLNYFLGNSTGSKYCPICEAVTSVGDVISLTSANINYAFRAALSLQKIPILNGNNQATEASSCFMNSSKIKKISLNNIKIFGSNTFRDLPLLEKIECENAFVQLGPSTYTGCAKLKEIPPTKNVNNLTFVNNVVNLLYSCSSLNPTFLDFTEYNNKTKITLGGSSSVPLNVKGMVVSNEAPFNNTTAPQIDVSYTGMDRAALVNLFKSMPYNVGYEVVGSPTITDGVVSGFSNKINYLTTSTLAVRDLAKSEFVWKLNCNGYSIPVFSIGNNSGLWVYVMQPNTVRVKIGDDTRYDFTLPSTFNLTDTFFYKITLENYICSLYFGSTKESMTLIDTHTFTPTNPTASGNLRIGSENWNWSSGTDFAGSIDLNNTYIKINGVPWFTGKAAMTKNCTIVGCTGTADLTQDDKNIALNKGWELTVA